MMEREALVARVEGGRAFLKFDPGGCARCSDAGGCSTGVLNQVFGAQCQLQSVPDTLGLRAGERVRVVSPDGLVWRAALMLYGLPTIVGLGGAALGATRGDGAAVVGLLAGLCMGFAVTRLVVKHTRWGTAQPVMVRGVVRVSFSGESNQ